MLIFYSSFFSINLKKDCYFNFLDFQMMVLISFNWKFVINITITAKVIIIAIIIIKFIIAIIVAFVAIKIVSFVITIIIIKIINLYFENSNYFL